MKDKFVWCKDCAIKDNLCDCPKPYAGSIECDRFQPMRMDGTCIDPDIKELIDNFNAIKEAKEETKVQKKKHNYTKIKFNSDGLKGTISIYSKEDAIRLVNDIVEEFLIEWDEVDI